jgi:L-cysteine/cystine lyase
VTYEEARAEFPVLERFAYLNAGTLGPLARSTLAAMDSRMRVDQEQGRGGRAWFESTLELRARVRERIASLLGTQPDRIALTSSTTDGCNIAVAGLGLGDGDEVVTTDSEHPGLLLPLHVSGARVRVAEVAGHPTPEALERIAACVSPRTRLLALSHVLWTTGQVMPVHELRQETGLPVLVDGAQSVGAIPVTVGELDWYTVSGSEVALWAGAARRALRSRRRVDPHRVPVVLRADLDRARRNVRPEGGCGAVRLRLARAATACGL